MATGGVALLTLATIGQANGTPDQTIMRGVASPWPLGAIVIDPGSGYSGLRLKNPGDQLTPPAPWSNNGNLACPDYGSIFSGLTMEGIDDIEVDAHSSGNGVIPRHDGDGIPDLPTSWMGLTISVANGARGFNNSHYLPGLAGGETGSELATVYMSSSQGIDPAFNGKSILETTRTQVGFSATSLSDIAAIDYGIGAITFNDPAVMTFFPGATDYYFSVTREWAGNNLSLSFADDGSGTMIPPNATDIYLMTWDSVLGSWSGPEVYISGDTLGLNRLTADVDAIAVDPNRKTVIFSATRASRSQYTALDEVDVSQLMIYQAEDFSQAQHPSGEPSTALKDSSGDRFTKKARLGDNGNNNEDEIDGACAIDPEMGVNGREAGTPIGHAVSLGEPAGLSVFRGTWGAPGNEYDRTLVQLTGWGNEIPVNCRVQLRVHDGGGPDFGNSAGWTDVGARIFRARNQHVMEFDVPETVLSTVNSRCQFHVVFYSGDVPFGGSMFSEVER